MAISKVVVVDGNNLIVRIDRGVAGRGVTDVEPIEIDGSLYLVFTFSDGTTETVGPVGTIQYIGQAPIVVSGSTISLSTVPVNLGGTGQITANAGFNALAPTQTGNSGKYLKTDGTNSAWDLLDISTADITGVLPLVNGGTGASTASGARTNLGLGTIATQDASNVAITGGSITGITDLAVADGGTGASTASGARTNLNAADQATTISAGTGLSGGGDLSANRTLSIANTTVTAAAYGSASNTLTATVNAQGQLTALAATPIAITNTQISGLGTMSTQNANSVAITGGSITGITDLAVADGGTGASDAAGARTNLNAANQATTITAGTGLSGGGDLSANRTIDIANTTVTAGSFGSASNTLTATVNAQGQLTALAAIPIAIANTQISGLGTMSTQNSNAVTITGGSITGITDLALADGGTGASNAPDARSNLGLGSAAVLNAGVALGVATLDAGGTVPLSQIPASIQGGVSYQGAWNASTNTPTLVSSVGSKGYYYVVSVAGNTNLNGVTDWLVGDWAIYNGTAWEKIDNTDQVASVNGYTGVVVLSNTDVGAPPTSLTISAGTGLSGGGSLAANRTLSIANTTVTAAPYGTASAVPTFTVNGQGQLTAASDVTIAIANTQVSGLGTMSTQNANSVAITGGSITGITDLAIADGGTGASTAPDARTNLGLGTIATQDASSVAITGGSINGTTIGATTPSTVTGTTVTANTRFVGTNFDASGSGGGALRTSSSANVLQWGGGGGVNLTLDGAFNMNPANASISIAPTGTGTLTINPATAGTINNMAIGGTTPRAGAFTTLTASTAIGIASGGTGQATANAAFNSLAPSQTGNSGKYLTTDGTDTSWASNPLGTVTSVAASVPSFLSIAGSPITTSGTLAISLSGTALPTTSGGTGLTSFTSGGVVYASSSSALATGSALTFDGTNLETTGRLILRTNASPFAAGQFGYSSTGGNYIWAKAGTTGSQDNFFIFDDSGNAAYGINSSRSHIWSVSGSEGMRLTSSSLYTASGINVGIGLSNPTIGLTVEKNNGSGYIAAFRSGTGNPYITLQTTGGITQIQGINSAFTDVNNIAMQISGGNVGIGTSSPSGKLDVVGVSDGDNVIRASTNSSNGIIILRPDGANGNVLRWGGNGANANTFRFISGGELERMRIDSLGNLGLGVAPVASVYTDSRNFFVGQASNLIGRTTINFTSLNTNVYEAPTTSAATFINASTAASQYQQYLGAHIWRTSTNTPTANASIVWSDAMTLDANAALILDGGTGKGRITLENGATANTIFSTLTAFGGYNILRNRASQHQWLDGAGTQAMTLTASGELLVGATSPILNGAVTIQQLSSSASGSTTLSFNHFHGDNKYVNFGWYGASIGSITQVGGAYVNYSTTSSASTGAQLFNGGVSFASTQNPSADANTLDDYEEGFHTCTVTPATSGTITLYAGVSSLAYTKVGRLVTVQGLLQVSSVSVPVGTSVRISLPFAVFSFTGTEQYASFGATTVLCKNVLTTATYSRPNTYFDVFVTASTVVADDQIQFGFSYIA